MVVRGGDGSDEAGLWWRTGDNGGDSDWVKQNIPNDLDAKFV